MDRENVVYSNNEYHSALKKKEISQYATTWKGTEDIMLSKISKITKDEYCMIPFIRGI